MQAMRVYYCNIKLYKNILSFETFVVPVKERNKIVIFCEKLNIILYIYNVTYKFYLYFVII